MPPTDTELHLVSFRVGSQLYGVDIMQVHRVLAFKEPVPVPGAPDPVLGMVDVHGRLVAVVDLEQVLGLSRQSRGRRLLVVQWAERMVALVVDDVEARLRLRREDLLAPPEEVGVPAVAGAFRLEQEMGLLLDPNRLRLDRLVDVAEDAGE